MPADVGHPSLPLGAALSTLLSDDADPVEEDPTALDALAAFLRDGSPCSHLLEIILDAGADKSRGVRRHRRVAVLLRWLLTHPEYATTACTACAALPDEAGLAPGGVRTMTPLDAQTPPPLRPRADSGPMPPDA